MRYNSPPSFEVKVLNVQSTRKGNPEDLETEMDLGDVHLMPIPPTRRVDLNKRAFRGLTQSWKMNESELAEVVG
jgi:hypothetical protein